VKLTASALRSFGSFVVPLFIRLVPEAFAGRYPLGFDTITYYLPIITSQVALRTSLIQYFGGTILMYLVLTCANILFGNALLLMKIVPAILLGFFGYSAYVLGLKFLKWPARWSFAFAMVAALNFVMLRVSWDLDRNLLGMSLILIATTYLYDAKSKKRSAIVAAALSIAVMVHDSSALLVGFVGGAFLIVEKRILRLKDWLLFLPAGALLAAQLAIGRGLGAQLHPEILSINPVSQLAFNSGFIVFALGFMIPIAVVGVREELRHVFAVWGAVSMFFALAPNFGLNTGEPHRWTFLLAVPLAVLFIQGSRVLWSIKKPKVKAFGKTAAALSLVALVFMSSGYIGLHQGVHSYFELAPEYSVLMPVSMVESSIAVSDIPSITAIAKWANETLRGDAILVLPFQLYGWYIVTLGRYNASTLRPLDQRVNLDEIIADIRPETGPQAVYARQVDLYRPTDVPTLVGLVDAFARGSGVIGFVVWWGGPEGGGWRGQLPGRFVPVFVAGNFAVYQDGL